MLLHNRRGYARRSKASRMSSTAARCASDLAAIAAIRIGKESERLSSSLSLICKYFEYFRKFLESLLNSPRSNLDNCPTSISSSQPILARVMPFCVRRARRCAPCALAWLRGIALCLLIILHIINSNLQNKELRWRCISMTSKYPGVVKSGATWWQIHQKNFTRLHSGLDYVAHGFRKSPDTHTMTLRCRCE